MKQHVIIGLKGNVLYTVLFSVLGVFSYILLINYAPITNRVADDISSVGVLFFFILAFNLLGFATLQVSSWINKMYIGHVHNQWKIIFIYIGVTFAFLVLNYSLLVVAKLLAKATHPFLFPNGGWKILILVWLVELVVLGLVLANRFMQQSLQFQAQAAKLQKENNTARYTALQQQLNPHFLFNSLNTLVAEINYNPQNAIIFTQRLSDVYRYVIQCQNSNLVSLADELEFIKSYLFLHEVRLGECISCRIDVDEEHKECLLPPLTLQLLIENVIKHNSISLSKPMSIDIFVDKDMLIISNPIRLKKNNSSSGLGLKNLSNRFMLMMNHDIIIESENGVFTVKVPLSL